MFWWFNKGSEKMLEMLVNPKSENQKPLKMLFIGILYGSLSLILVKLFFSGDAVLSKYSGMIVVTFCVMFSLPFMYYLIKREEAEDETVEGILGVWRAHSDAMYAFMFLID